jgi:imidazolonepropionase-like amidohydrolase
MAVAKTPAAKHALDVAAVTKTYVESGYTMIIGAGTTQADDDLLAKAAIDQGELPGPRIVPGGPMIAGAGGLGDEGGLMEVATDARSMREIVARQCDVGVRAIKLFVSGDGIVNGYPSEALYMNDAMVEAAVTEADRHGGFVTAHARGTASVAMSARTGVRVIHHACFIDDEAMKQLQARGNDVWVCPGLHYLWAMVNGRADPWGMTPERIERSGYRTELKSQVAGIKAMAAAGIKLVAGGDFGHQWTKHGTYAAELQRYVDQCGLAPTAAIHTATRNFASLIGLDVGQVREGALADLVVVDGDPTADITVLQQTERRRAVLKAGRFAYVNPAVYP